MVAEGLYALLHLGGDVRETQNIGATSSRSGEISSGQHHPLRDPIRTSVTRCCCISSGHWSQMLLSVQAALKCSLMIKPDLCQRYVQLWRGDLADWKRRVAGIP